MTVDYQAKGSGAGIQDLINKTVDFAASDAAMTPDQIAKVADGVVLLPMTAGEIVLAYNLPGQPKNLKLPRDVYPDIFRGANLHLTLNAGSSSLKFALFQRTDEFARHGARRDW